MLNWQPFVLPLLSVMLSLLLFFVYSCLNQTSPHLKYDDPKLIELLRSEVLVSPAPHTSKLNLSKERIWKSPVAELVREALGNERDGFFVEVGAYDGERLSNTIELEEYLGWTGLLLEADPILHAQLTTKRRKAWSAHGCLSSEPNSMSVPMFRFNVWPFLVRVPPVSLFDFENLKLLQEAEEQFEKFEVQCYPLYSMMRALYHHGSAIDYLSLRVEGEEWTIIQTIPFDKLTIKVLSMEIHFNGHYWEIKAYLQALGYSTLEPVEVTAPGVHLTMAVFVHKSVSK